MKKLIQMLKDGPKIFQQWDENRKLEVLDSRCTQVHFANANSELALVCPVVEEKGIRVVAVPNILLQEALELVAYLTQTDADGRTTLYTARFQVLPRKQPENYVYTPTQVLRYEQLEQWLRELEQRSVNSVNGVAPDEMGNVQLPIPEAAPSDWKAAQGEPGHIANRTHWVERGTVEIMPKTVLDMTAGETVLPNKLGLEAGKAYTVMWNGTSYTCTAVAAEEDGITLVAMGNLTGIPNKEPFFMFEVPDELAEEIGFAVGISCWSSGRIPVAIYTDGDIVHKLDNKFVDAEWMAITQKRVGDILYSGTADVYPGGGFMGGTPDPVLLGLVPGETYCVYIHGEEYVCVAKSIPGNHEGWMDTVYIGDGSQFGGEATGEPFVIADAQFSDDDVHGFFTGGVQGVESGTIPVVIQKAAVIPSKLPYKFLPDGVPYVEKTVYLEESEASDFTHPSFGKMWGIYEGVPNLKVGETYTITYNGVPYRCVCQAAPAGLVEDPNAVAMGNFSVVGGANTGEPFAMLISYTYQEVDVIDLTDADAVKIKIHTAIATPEIYLSSPNGTVFQITVSDNGNIAVTQV